MLFSRKGKLKKEFDEKLVSSIKETKEALQSAKVIEGLTDDYNLSVIAERKKPKAYIITYIKKRVYVVY